MSTEPPASQPTFSGRVFEEQRQQALLGNTEPALVRARVLLAVVVVAAALSPVFEAQRWLWERMAPSDPDLRAGPSAWPLLLVAIAGGVGLLYRARGGRSPRGLVGVALAVGAAVDLCATSVILADHEMFVALPVLSLLVVDFGVPVASLWVVVVAGIAWKSNERGAGPLAVAVLSVVLIAAATAAMILPAFAFGGSIS